MDELFAHLRRGPDAADPDQDGAPDESTPGDASPDASPDASEDTSGDAPVRHDDGPDDQGSPSGEATPAAPPPPPDDETPWPSWVRRPAPPRSAPSSPAPSSPAPSSPAPPSPVPMPAEDPDPTPPAPSIVGDDPGPVERDDPEPVEHDSPDRVEHDSPDRVEHDAPDRVEHDDPEPVEHDAPDRVERDDPEPVGHDDPASDLTEADPDGDEDMDDPVDWRSELAADDPDATMVLPLSGRDGVRHGDDTPRAVWDTGTIRRWDPTMSDGGARTVDDDMHRPHRLDDRSDVDVSRRDDDGGGRWYEIPLMILTALTLAFLLRTFVVQVFYIPSVSMIPTMEINDRIAVEKLSYLARDPARGEVVVFAGDDPFADTTVESTQERVLTGVGQFLGVVPVDAKDFVKRVIGLPGDTVVLERGVVTVNGVELDEPYALLDQDNGEWTVPAGQLFVLGDNRGNSGDSRSSLGYVPIDDVVGRAIVTLWPFDRAGSIPGEDHDVAVDAGS